MQRHTGTDIRSFGPFGSVIIALLLISLTGCGKHRYYAPVITAAHDDSFFVANISSSLYRFGMADGSVKKLGISYEECLYISSLAISRDGKRLLIAGKSSGAESNRILLWDITKDAAVRTIALSTNDVSGAEFLGTSERIIISAGGIVSIVDTQKRKTVNVQTDQYLYGIAVSHDDRYAAAISGRDAALIDVKKGTITAWYQTKTEIETLAFADTSRYLIIGGRPRMSARSRAVDTKDHMAVFDTRTHARVEVKPRIEESVYHAVGSRTSPQAVILRMHWDDNASKHVPFIHVLDIEAGTMQVRTPPFKDQLYRFSFERDSFHITPSGRYALLQGDEETIRLWDIEGNSIVKEFPLPDLSND